MQETYLSEVLKLYMEESQGILEIPWINNGILSTPYFTHQLVEICSKCVLGAGLKSKLLQEKFQEGGGRQ